MFEKITLQRSTGRQPLTAGELAEALLFYKNVHILFNETNLAKLARSMGTPILIDILQRPDVSAVYCRDGVAVTMTNFVGGAQYHDCCSIEGINRNIPQAITDRTELFEVLLERSGASSGFEAKRYARQLRKLVPFRSYAGDDFVAGGLFAAARQDALDHEYVYEVVRRSLHALVPLCAPLPRFRFDVIKADGGFIVDTDLDFARLTELLPEADRLNLVRMSPAVLLDIVFTTRVDLTIAAHYESELHTWSLVSKLMRLRCADILKRANPGLEEIATFQDSIFPKGRAIKEAIDSGERCFADFLPVLERSQPFRSWAHEVSPDEKLVREYIAAVSSEPWISSMPVKALRFVFGTQVLMVDPSFVVGLAVAVADSLLLDRLLRGWRPNHFVDNELKPFVGNMQGIL